MFAVIWNDPNAEEVRFLRIARTEEEATRLMGEVHVPGYAQTSEKELQEIREEEPDYEPAHLKVVNLMSSEADDVLADLNSYLENTEEDAFNY